MLTLLLSIKPIKLPKYLAFKIMESMPQESFKYTHEVVEKYPNNQIMKGACINNNIKILKPCTFRSTVNAHYLSFNAGKYNSAAVIKYLLENESMCWIKLLYGAARGGHKELIEMALKEAELDRTAIYFACRGGHYEIYLAFSQQKINHFNAYYLRGAWRGKNLELINKITCELNNFKAIMSVACRTNDLEWVKFVANNYEVDWTGALYESCKKNNLEMVYFVHQYDNDFNGGLLGAAAAGNIALVKQMINIGANQYSEAAELAAIKGHDHIIELLKKYNAVNFDLVLSKAVVFGQLKIVNKYLKYQLDKVDDYFILACVNGYLFIVKYLLKYNVNNNLGFYKACCNEFLEVAELIRKKGITNLEILKKTPRGNGFSEATVFYLLSIK